MNNQTYYPNNRSIVIFANLTDDMGNPITNQHISFYINGVFISDVTVVEGIANFTYNFTPGTYVISGSYIGSGNHTINIFDGIISYQSNVSSNLTLDKDKILVNETVI